MAESRIKVARNKAELVKELTASSETTGPFHTYADVMVFAAVLGAKQKKRVPLEEISKKEPGPIALEIFISRGYDVIFKLLAIVETKDKAILASNEENSEKERIHIFEEYANGGLEILREELRGAVDYTERLLLMLSWQREKQEPLQEDFDLSRFFG
jgi:dnd system-associated protein 4